MTSKLLFCHQVLADTRSAESSTGLTRTHPVRYMGLDISSVTPWACIYLQPADGAVVRLSICAPFPPFPSVFTCILLMVLWWDSISLWWLCISCLTELQSCSKVSTCCSSSCFFLFELYHTIKSLSMSIIVWTKWKDHALLKELFGLYVRSYDFYLFSTEMGHTWRPLPARARSSQRSPAGRLSVWFPHSGN